MSQQPILDYVIFGVPFGTVLDDDMRARLDRASEALLMRQYRGRRHPRALLLDATRWLITSSWEDVLAFQPDDGCPTCLAGNDQAVAFLKEHPDRCLALGNLSYVEVW